MAAKQAITQQRYQHLSENSFWFADTPLASLKLRQSSINTLLLDRGSLTAGLMNLSAGDFEVNVLSQGIAVPHWHEQKKLHRAYSSVAIIREVELLISGQAVVFARTIIPYTLMGSRLKDLGKTPLGHLLFKDGKIRVSKREFALIESSEALIKARRTPYEYQGETILVSEFFLPKLNSFLA